MGEALYMECGAKILSLGMESKVHPITSEARASFYEAFNLSPDEQKDMEDMFERLQLKWGQEVVQLDSITPLGNLTV